MSLDERHAPFGVSRRPPDRLKLDINFDELAFTEDVRAIQAGGDASFSSKDFE
jgi:hypothetical protein